MKKVGIISAGAWGTALGKIIAELGNEVVMWDFMTDVVDDINHNNTNARYLLGVRLPPNLQATTDITLAAADKDFIIVATPSLYMIDSVKKIAAMPGVQEGNTFIAVVTKGFISGEEESKLLIEAIEEYLPEGYRNNLVYISGPSHAEEVSRGKLTGLIAACPNGRNAIRFRELLTGSTLMVFPSLDIVGVQTCGAVKNVVAIAFGMLDAMMEFSDSFGDNTESLLLAAGLNEIQLLGTALGSTHPETFTSIAGVGDLDVTCRSRHGRNRRFGREIIKDRILARFKDLEDLIRNISSLGFLPEGAVAAKFVHEIARQRKLKLPICETVYSILNCEVNPSQAVSIMVENLGGALSQTIPDA
ncbi:NAD(P)H-dependent glycerol-3-phosphate dehydrogenase [Marispirochaeta aestuarii]|uniref:NAD(P)H-dependent glycerol-3-phosphate dehydrogenase n=1 Tax=Marispirochaeta aestuarii TaxID=1963862 RepID=UPI0029C68946|nr:NAD(P)H-dependent glycerol-3-phosphate dehydrogenase [Marispirochaeta aestuarii]